jgi:hypothetical protein
MTNDDAPRGKLAKHIFGAATIFVLGTVNCTAQMSTMGTTQLAIPTTPGAIVSSPLGGPGPFTSLFSAATVPGAPATTLASPPLADDPTIPGTSVSCTPAAVALSPSVMSVTATTTGASASPTAAMNPVGVSTTSTPNAMPTTSSLASSNPTTSNPSQPLLLPPAMPVLIAGAVSGSTTGTVTTAPPLGSPPPGSSCISAPGNTLTSATAMPLAIGDVPASPSPGTLQSPVAALGSTSIEPATAVMPTPNSPACSESVSFNLANPAMMAPANATSAGATPGVMPQGC